MTVLHFHEMCPLSGEVISWEGEIDAVVEEMLELYQHRTECDEFVIESLRITCRSATTPQVKAKLLRSAMTLSANHISATYIYGWQVSV